MEAIFGVDIADPSLGFDRTEFVHADTRQSFLSKLVRQLELDTVIHCAVLAGTRGSPKAIHETNVIGTMNVLAACSGTGSPVRRVVVKSSVAVYDTEPFDPSFLSEDMAGRRPARSPVAGDLLELEQLATDHALRARSSTVTILRFGYRLGARHSNPLSDYLSLPRIPTYLGYDPRIQLLHHDDGVEALYRAALADHPGTYNVAAPGVLLLSQVIALTGRTRLPVLLPLGQLPGRLAIRLATGLDLPEDVARFLATGVVVDTSRLEQEFGWLPGHDTREVIMEFVHRRNERDPSAVPAPEEKELQGYLRRRTKRARVKAVRG